MADETPSSQEANDKLQQSQEHFQQATDDLKGAANAKANDLKGKASDIRDAATAKASDLKDAASARFDDIKSTASAKADEYRAAASAKAEELRGQAEAAWGDAKVRARTFQEDGEEYVRHNPTRAVLLGLGAGFVLGLILRK